MYEAIVAEIVAEIFRIVLQYTVFTDILPVHLCTVPD
jgi:hypothetical protein